MINKEALLKAPDSPSLVKAHSDNNIESLVESLGSVDLSSPVKADIDTGSSKKKDIEGKRKKWTRQKVGRKPRETKTSKLAKELGKRQLVDVAISEGGINELRGGDKKKKQYVVMVDSSDHVERVVLLDQHHPTQ